MKLTQDAGELKIHYNLLMHDCLKAHNEKMRRDNEFEYFSRKISRMVKYSKIDSVIYNSMMYIVVAGLGFTGLEKFAPK